MAGNKTMTESKMAGGYPGNGGGPHGSDDQRDTTPTVDRHPRELVNTENPKANSWDTYRRWLTRVQAPGGRRAPLDPSLYTWKGYRSWSEKVRRDWKAEE